MVATIKSPYPGYCARPKGGIVEVTDLNDALFITFESRMQPKIGWNGHEHRVVFQKSVCDNEFEYTQYYCWNRHGEQYSKDPNGINKAIKELGYLFDKGFEYVDCGYFAAGPNAGKVCIYDLPNSGLTYDEVQRVLQAHYPISMEKSVVDNYREFTGVDMRDDMMQKDVKLDCAMLSCASSYMSFMLPTFGGIVINDVWRALRRTAAQSTLPYVSHAGDFEGHKKVGYSTYEGIVHKLGCYEAKLTTSQSDNLPWTKVKYR